MAGFRALICLLIFLALANLASAAAIHGTVYDLSLNKANNVKVEINTVPKQSMIVQNGSYSFNAPNGDYTIKAQQIQISSIVASVQENITIRQTGSYVLDLILFPDVEEGVEDADIEVNDVAGANNGSLMAIAIIIVFSIAALIYFIFKNGKQENLAIDEDKNKKEKILEDSYQDEEIQKIIELLKKEGGRATQKEIRKEIPLSEAKISLMIAELEHKGAIEKIKRGRGNIIILRKAEK